MIMPEWTGSLFTWIHWQPFHHYERGEGVRWTHHMGGCTITKCGSHNYEVCINVANTRTRRTHSDPEALRIYAEAILAAEARLEKSK